MDVQDGNNHDAATYRTEHELMRLPHSPVGIALSLLMLALIWGGLLWLSHLELHNLP
jgi:hypothetical protein